MRPVLHRRRCLNLANEGFVRIMSFFARIKKVFLSKLTIIYIYSKVRKINFEYEMRAAVHIASHKDANHGQFWTSAL